ncbi:hypothetical protein V1264_015598 [Littorina saxatilis]|uniref:CUB domain-containing protein n=2 Tax=Littorina saxatilis TaxID=31220 RepID=A0AAN9GG63_9CAEN
MGLGKSYECGGFIEMTSGGSGAFQSPGYPGNYPNYTRCIWILEAPESHIANLTVNFVGETYNSQCSDYVEFRDGGQTGAIIQTNCGTMTSETVTSTGRWMYVFFHSDGFSQVNGLSVTYTATDVGASINDSITDPTGSCRSYEFECRNKICLSRSYRCDGYYDCGCGSDCDEDGCVGLPLNAAEMIATGLGVGVVVFLVAATLGKLLEKHHNWEKEGGPGNKVQTRRWGSGKKDAQKRGENYKPDPAKPVSPKMSSCTVKVSEIN